MWQSQVEIERYVAVLRVEIEHYSIAYFDRVIVFKALQRRTSVKGGAHTHYVDLHVSAFSLCV